MEGVEEGDTSPAEGRERRTPSNNSFSGGDQVGGGIFNGWNATVINSTISGNSGPANGIGGGGIGNGSFSLTVEDCTFSGNSAHSGGAIYNWTGGTIRVGDTVFNAGATGGTLFNNSGTITSRGYNLTSDKGGGFLTATGDQANTDPMLGPLQDNGGPTFTHALLPGSPAIDMGDPNFDPNAFTPPLSDDQRGSSFSRVVNGRVDIGAFEVQAPPSADLSITKAAAPNPTVVASTCKTDVSAQVTVKLGRLAFNRKSKLYSQNVALTDKGAALSGVVLVIRDLSVGATLTDASGVTSCTSTGNPFVTVGTSTPGIRHSTSVTVTFIDPSRAPITYNTSVLAGSGTP